MRPTENTINDLSQWVLDVLPNAIFSEIGGELVIHTGLTEDLGGYLYPIEKEEDDE